MNKTTLNIQAVTHRYSTHKPPVLDNVNIRIEPGQIYGILGRNGEGKSTLLQLCLNLICPQDGEIKLLNEPSQSVGSEVLQMIGFVPEVCALPHNLRVDRLIEWASHLRQNWDQDHVLRLLSAGNIDLNQSVKNLSQGQQRLLEYTLASAFKPKLLLCDEPSAHLDAVLRQVMMEDMLSLSRDHETSILLTSHLLNDLERVVSHIGILSNHQLIVDEPLDDLKDTLRNVHFPAAHISEARLSDMDIIRHYYDGPDTWAIIKNPQLRQLQAVGVSEYDIRPMNLEELFIALTRN